MFDLNSINKRFFEIKVGDTILELEPPNLKMLKKINKLAKVNDSDSMDELEEVVKGLLNKNRKKIDVSGIVENLDTDQMQMFMLEFLRWLNDVKNSKN